VAAAPDEFYMRCERGGERYEGKAVVRRYQSAPSIGIRQLECVVVVRAGGAHRDAEVDDAAR